MKHNDHRINEARSLRRQGIPPSEIADRMGVSRQTIWRYCRNMDAGPVAMPAREAVAVSGSAPSTAPAGVVIDVDWETARSECVDVLRTRAAEGSVTAAAQLARIANTELRTAIPCENHVSAEDFWRYVQEGFDLWKSTLLSAFARKLNLEFPDVPLERIEELIEDVSEDVAREMNARIAAAMEAQNE